MAPGASGAGSDRTTASTFDLPQFPGEDALAHEAATTLLISPLLGLAHCLAFRLLGASRRAPRARLFPFGAARDAIDGQGTGNTQARGVVG